MGTTTPDTYEAQTQFYTYSADGYLTEVEIARGSPTADVNATGTPSHGSANVLSTYMMDAMGRVTDYKQFKNGLGTLTLGHLDYERTASYDNASNVTTDTVTEDNGTVRTQSVTSYDYDLLDGSAYTGAYMGGALVHSRTTTTQTQGGNTASVTADTVNAYQWWDTAQVATTSATPDTSKSTVNTSTYIYTTPPAT